MSNAADQGALERLHNAIATELADVITNGEKVVDKASGEVVKLTASAAYFAAAIKLLKDNNIKCALTGNTPLDQLGEAVAKAGVTLPFEGSNPVSH